MRVDQCSPGTNAGVWNMNLSVAGQTLVLPIYVNPTAGPATALGAYNLRICLPPWDVPVGTPGRAFDGAQLLDAKFTVNKIFTTPTTAGMLKWETLFTPYTPGKGTPNAAGTFEARAFVPIPILLGHRVSYVKKKKHVDAQWHGDRGRPSRLRCDRQRRARSFGDEAHRGRATAKTGATGAWKTSGKLIPKKTTYFQVSASVGERDYTATGCQSPLTPFAPAGCVTATLSPWSRQECSGQAKALEPASGSGLALRAGS